MKKGKRLKNKIRIGNDACLKEPKLSLPLLPQLRLLSSKDYDSL